MGCGGVVRDGMWWCGEGLDVVVWCGEGWDVVVC